MAGEGGKESDVAAFAAAEALWFVPIQPALAEHRNRDWKFVQARVPHHKQLFIEVRASR